MQKLWILMTIPLLLISGCSVFPPPAVPQVHYYAIGSPKTQPAVNRPINITTITDLTGSGTAMRFRTAAGDIVIDHNKRWLNQPAVMVRRYLTLALTTAAHNQHPLQLTAELLTFNCDLAQHCCRLAILIRLYDNNRLQSQQLYHATEKVTAQQAGCYARAMEQALHRIVVKLAENINKLR